MRGTVTTVSVKAIADGITAVYCSNNGKHLLYLDSALILQASRIRKRGKLL